METIDVTLANLIEVAMYFEGSQPSFKLDLKRGQVLLTDACSGFLKKLFEDPRVCASLHGGTIGVMYFKA